MSWGRKEKWSPLGKKTPSVTRGKKGKKEEKESDSRTLKKETIKKAEEKRKK